MALQSAAERVSLSQIIGICTSASLQLQKTSRELAYCELSILTPRNTLDLAVLSVFICIFVYFAFMYNVQVVTHRSRTSSMRREESKPLNIPVLCSLISYIIAQLYGCQ